jgi:hypothetical protein
MPRGRHLSRTLRALAALACWALPPAAAEAAPVDTVESTVAAVALPVQNAGEDVAGVTRPVAEALTPSGPVPGPSDPAAGAPVDETVAPIAHGATGAVPASAAAVPQEQLHEPAKAGASHITAGASAERSGGRAEREQGSGAGAGRHPSPQRGVTAEGSAKEVSSAAEEASKASAQPLAPSPEPDSGPLAAASGAAMGSLRRRLRTARRLAPPRGPATAARRLHAAGRLPAGGLPCGARAARLARSVSQEPGPLPAADLLSDGSSTSASLQPVAALADEAGGSQPLTGLGLVALLLAGLTLLSSGAAVRRGSLAAG